MNCPICKGNTINYVNDLLRCIRCLHIFKNELIDGGIYTNYLSSAHTKKTEEHVKNAIISANYRINIITPYVKSGSLLELGSGHRYFLDVAKEKGFSVEGTELSRAMIEDIQDHKIHYGNPSEIKDLGMYDVICGFHVLEHMNNPVEELLILKSHLKENGIIVIEIPTMLFYGNVTSTKDFYQSAHTQYFGQYSIITMCDAIGMVPIMQINWFPKNIAYTIIVLTKDKSLQEENMWKTLNYMLRRNENE